MATQHWETVASGLRPRPGDGLVDASLAPPINHNSERLPGRTGRAALPWSVVRLVNLAVIEALGLQRAREHEEQKREAAPARGEDQRGGEETGALANPRRPKSRASSRNPALASSDHWAEVVLQRLVDSAQWERRLRRGKGALGLEAWRAKWGWLFSTPIT